MNVFSHPLDRLKVAVIGGGISGLGAAFNLSGSADVTLFEAKYKLGGHAHTVLAGKHKNQPVDMGFIVFKEIEISILFKLMFSIEFLFSR